VKSFAVGGAAYRGIAADIGRSYQVHDRPGGCEARGDDVDEGEDNCEGRGGGTGGKLSSLGTLILSTPFLEHAKVIETSTFNDGQAVNKEWSP